MGSGISRKAMNKYQIYVLLGGAICVFMLWDMADYFIGGLGFPRGDWESYTFLLPMLLLVVISLISREKKKQEASAE
jgi:membrane protein DedA with SNARE-associated domain